MKTPGFPRPPVLAYSPVVADTLNINEIYLSLQGESTFAGLPCVFVRLTACNLRCSYCDTAYAFTEGTPQGFDQIIGEVEKLALPYQGSHVFAGSAGRHRLPLVEFTGGEPLLQRGSALVMQQLCDKGFTVLVETSGAWDIGKLDARIRRIMDLKCPSSGESSKNRWENLAHLRETDEVKFVIGTHEDYQWAKQAIREHRLDSVCPLLFSWVAPLNEHQRDKSLKTVPLGQNPISRVDLVESIVRDSLPVRFQLQMHKFIWPPDQKGV
ncbi:MAG TPA: 7-carboxy-7-deazaguanine synthase [Candidatus Limnocylindria bacterium]|nr:7-carboxy-7-deazaguanine synthase [Candidatus Limnocylindria bacterium]